MRFFPGVRYWRLGVLPMVLLGAMLVSACEKPDASYLTSPSADLLIGTTTGNVAFLPPETAPDPVTSPAGWDERLELALFGELEDGTDALRIVLTMKSQAGKGFEVWLSDAQGTVARWSGGSSKPYNGVVCFQMPMTAKVNDKATGVTHAEAMNLPPGLYNVSATLPLTGGYSIGGSGSQTIIRWTGGPSDGPVFSVLDPQNSVLEQMQIAAPDSVACIRQTSAGATPSTMTYDGINVGSAFLNLVQPGGYGVVGTPRANRGLECVGLPGEVAGRMLPASRVPIELATLSYGYGISVTPLQLARAYAVLANGGTALPVSLIKNETAPPQGERVMSEQTARQVRGMLEQAVSRDGTGANAQVAYYRVGGKTGTAHKLVNGEYASNSYIASFAGFAPASNPRLVMIVSVDEPQGTEYFGAQVAAPVFSKAMAGALRLLDIPPDKLDGPARRTAQLWRGEAT